mmetsp:Transcript_31994/g.56571  ORF Transcript_31994/g.56571 Transcript_31994/m.56571 type:complete len:761 (-) Transcript_31994:196-2478(-)
MSVWSLPLLLGLSSSSSYMGGNPQHCTIHQEEASNSWGCTIREADVADYGSLTLVANISEYINNFSWLQLKVSSSSEPETEVSMAVSFGDSIIQRQGNELNLWCGMRKVHPGFLDRPLVAEARFEGKTSTRLDLNLKEIVREEAGKTVDFDLSDEVPQPKLKLWKITETDLAVSHNQVRFNFKGHHPGNVTAFIFRVDANPSQCWMQAIGRVGCVDAGQLAKCFRTSNNQSMSLTFRKKGVAVLNKWSAPQLAAGEWAVLLDPDTKSQHVSLTLETKYAEDQWNLWPVSIFLVLLPILFVGSLHVLNQLLHKCFYDPNRLRAEFTNLRETIQHVCLNAEFCQFASMQCRRFSGAETYSGLIVVASAAFFVAALQTSGGKFTTFVRSGNQDACFYNFDCFVPWGLNFPVNNLISHIPYFVCGLLVIFLVLLKHQQAQGQTIRSKAAPSFRIFYALGVSVFMEGVGSLCYHLCPTQVQFQFDTALMFVISLLSILALLDTDAEACGVIPPMKLVMGLVVPMWLLSGVGTWFDYVLKDHLFAYVGYCLLVLTWVGIVLKEAHRLFPHQDRVGECRHTEAVLSVWILRIVVGLVVGLALICGDKRREAGGMSNIILYLSMGTMMMVTLRQMVRLDVWASCRRPSSVLVKYGLFAIFLVVSWQALVKFFKHVNDINASPAVSREHNRGCVWFGALDNHDIWHVLSALALTLWILVLLEMRLRIWKRDEGQLPQPAEPLGHTRSEGQPVSSSLDKSGVLLVTQSLP